MSVVMPNPTEAGAAADAPLRPDNEPYRFEMMFNGGGLRAYADTADELLAFLISGYDEMTQQQRAEARLHLAVRTQVTMQTEIVGECGVAGCTPEEAVVLEGHRTTTPDVTVWNSAVPLVLVDTYYKPYTDLPRPISGVADVQNPPNIFWLSPDEPYEFLTSLHRIGLIVLSEHKDSSV